MNRRQLFSKWSWVPFAAVLLASVTTAAVAADRGRRDRDARDHDHDHAPLVIRKQGSFFVGGRTIVTGALTGDPAGGTFPPNQGSITVDQMYVAYQVPLNVGGRLPVVMVHGGTLSGKSYETTPDGRMGWDEYFLRQHYPVYLVDQVSRARSGFDATIYNEVRMGLRPPDQLPNVLRLSHETGWTWWRVGPTPGVPFGNTQFPVEAVEEFQKQAIPDFNAILPAANPTFDHLATLANDLGGAILLGHSQSAFFPQRAAFIDASNIKGMVSLETGSCPGSFAPEEIAILAKVPMIILFGDHLDDAAPAYASRWLTSIENCRGLVRSINNAGGDATLVHLPEVGIFGNSHFLMFDKNNLQIADLIIDWIRRHVK